MSDLKTSAGMLKLVSKDEKKFTVEREYASISSRVKKLAESADDATTELPIAGAILELVVTYMKEHKGYEPPNLEKPLRSKSMRDVCPHKWDADYIDAIGETRQTLYDLVLAADYMDIRSLMHLACAKVASLIKGQPLVRIKEILAPNQPTKKSDAKDSKSADTPFGFTPEHQPVQYTVDKYTCTVAGACAACAKTYILRPKCVHPMVSGAGSIQQVERGVSADTIARQCAHAWSNAATQVLPLILERLHEQVEGNSSAKRASQMMFEYVYAPPLRVRWHLLASVPSAENTTVDEKTTTGTKSPSTAFRVSKDGHILDLESWIDTNRMSIPDNNGGFEFLARLLGDYRIRVEHIAMFESHLPSLTFSKRKRSQKQQIALFNAFASRRVPASGHYAQDKRVQAAVLEWMTRTWSVNVVPTSVIGQFVVSESRVMRDLIDGSGQIVDERCLPPTPADLPDPSGVVSLRRRHSQAAVKWSPLSVPLAAAKSTRSGGGSGGEEASASAAQVCAVLPLSAQSSLAVLSQQVTNNHATAHPNDPFLTRMRKLARSSIVGCPIL